MARPRLFRNAVMVRLDTDRQRIARAIVQAVRNENSDSSKRRAQPTFSAMNRENQTQVGIVWVMLHSLPEIAQAGSLPKGLFALRLGYPLIKWWCRLGDFDPGFLACDLASRDFPVMCQ